jgi:tryptophan synthase alpha chain
MTYSNIFVRLGFNKFMQEAKQCGIDGFILADMPIEESEQYIKEASNLDLATIFMVYLIQKNKELNLFYQSLQDSCM